MDLIFEGIGQAGLLIFQLDPLVVEIAIRSLAISVMGIAISMLVGIPLGLTLALNRFPGRNFMIGLVNTGMGVPPVVVGLFVALFLARNSVLGFLELLYTPAAMVIAQVVIASPLVAGVTVAAIQQLNPKLRLQSLALGATKTQMIWTLIKETRLLLMAAVMAGFGRIISEVGAVMMVGGNIRGQTQVLTTAIVEYVGRGQFAVAIALSIVLIGLIFAVNYGLTRAQQGEQKEATEWLGRT